VTPLNVLDHILSLFGPRFEAFKFWVNLTSPQDPQDKKLKKESFAHTFATTRVRVPDFIRQNKFFWLINIF
jgi:hypothetical protein